VLGLAAAARRILCELGGSVADGSSPIVAARFENRDVSALARALKEQRVLVAARRGHLRVSPHLYNNEQDLEVFKRALRALL
jgi:cysteine desulfurase/selenocysteine lyase